MIPLSQSLKRQNREDQCSDHYDGTHSLALIIPEVCTRSWTVKKKTKKEKGLEGRICPKAKRVDQKETFYGLKKGK